MNSVLVRRIPSRAILGAALLLPAALIVGCKQESGTSPPASQPAAAPTAAKGSQAPVVQANAAAVSGQLDLVNGDFIAGWAMDETKPTNPVTVDIYDGDVLLASIPAKDFRQDLLDAGKGDGNHAFALETPAKIKDGKPHTIHARCAGAALGGSPKTFPAS